MDDQGWLEVSLVVDGEIAEAVSEVLGRYIPGGVVIESIRISGEPGEEGHAEGPLRVIGYLEMDNQLENTKRKIEEALWHLGQIRPIPDMQTRSIASLDWSEIWKDHFQPVQIGSRLVIIPAWMEADQDLRLAVKIEPGMAFGTGTHPTTQLCLEIIADLISKEERGEVEGSRSSLNMIDVGCGSGILGIAALKLGVKRVLGVDLDPQAVKSARQNALLNGVSDRIELENGSLTEIKAKTFSLSHAELVVANILAPVIIRLLEAGLGELLTEGGRLILSGILEEQVPEVESALQAAGCNLVQKHQMGDWMALVAEQ
jgi:ribosomal protein L11 methyltransferase